MADAFFQVLIENVTSLIKSEVGLIMGVDNEMEKLSNTLTTIQNVLEDAEDRQFESKAIQNWLNRLNDMAFEIEGILYDCNTQFSRLKQRRGNKFLKKLKKVLYKRKVGRRIKEAAQKLEDIAKDRHNYHLKEIVVHRPRERDCRRETGSALNDPDHVYGRDEDRDKIVDVLVNQVSEQKLSVLPIFGLGGMGKTTLAQFIYNDERVTHHFYHKIWVCVSDSYNLKAILRAMIESVTRRKPEVEDLDSLQRLIRDELNGKRYLLILDDLWNDNLEDWDKLKDAVACGSMGSSIVVTTRMENVASITRTLPSHCLKELSEEHCWRLFKRRAFGQEDEQHHGNLEAIGRRIVKKCGGVPLAAKTLGGLLWHNRDERKWIHVEKSHMWDLPQEEDSILPALRLSYRHLPFELKRCFVYCAVFPKDHEFDKTEIIFNWMAHGFITSNATQEVEDVGDQIWNELSLRSFFQEVDTTSEGETTFKMHDLVHDLAQSIMKNKIPGAETESSSNTSVSNNKILEVHWNKFNSKFISSSIAVKVSTLTVIMNYCRLRILKLQYIDVEELPSAIGKLKKLRCLDLEGSSIRTLPRKFCSLYNLQILILKNCDELKSLPKNMRYLTNLRHILLEGCSSLSDTPYRIGELVSLKTLNLFIVGDIKGNQLDELEHLNLGGRLEIQLLERVKNHSIDKKANLVEKPNLRDLVLSWEGDSASSELTKRMGLDEKVLEALEPHPNLVALKIVGFRGRELALWMKSMENMTRVSIQKCRNCRHVSPLGGLPLLTSLELDDLEALEYIVEENGGGCEIAKFQSLEELKLTNLPNLKGWLKDGEALGRELALWMKSMKNMTRVSIRYCRNYRHVSPLGDLPLLKFLTLASLEALEYIVVEETGVGREMAKFPSLEELRLERLPNLKGWLKEGEVVEMFPNLQSLCIGYCESLRLPSTSGGLNCVTALELRNCKIGSCFPEGSLRKLTALQELDIGFCRELELDDVAEEMKHLHLLKRLIISDVDEMVSLPQALQHIPSLQSLTLWHLNKLTSLPDWLPNLASLTQLQIKLCRALTSLPNLASLTQLEIRFCPALTSLPSSIQGMTNLKSLTIHGCNPQLKRRCEEPNGEDWHNISHIPRLYIQ